MSEFFPPFLKWSAYTSKDERSPDVLNIEVLETELFETEYSTNLRVRANEEETILPIHSFESRNKQLLQLYVKAKKEGKIQVGKKFKLNTWLGISKNKFPIRRYELIF